MKRTPRDELMDDPGLDPAEHAAALRGLDRLNRVSRAGAVVWRALREALEAEGGEREGAGEVRVLDLACGSGGGVVAMQRRADGAGVKVSVDGCDVSRAAMERAKALAGRCGFFECDVLREALPGGYEVRMCSLFLHHLTRERAVGLLRAMGEGGEVVIVNDLVRGWVGWVAVWVASRVVTRSRVVRVDGPRSVGNAWTVGELRAMAAEAGLKGAVVRRAFPCRMVLTWRRGAA